MIIAYAAGILDHTGRYHHEKEKSPIILRSSGDSHDPCHGILGPSSHHPGGKVRSAGSSYSMFFISYNKSTKRLQGGRGGGGGNENWYYTLQSGVLKCVNLQALEAGMKNGKMTYNYYYDGRKISKSTYSRKLKKWNNKTTKVTFYKLTTSNIKKYMKM